MIETVKARSAGKRSRALEGVARQTDASEIAHSPQPANALTAILNREGMVIAVVGGRAPARAFLREGAR